MGRAFAAMSVSHRVDCGWRRASKARTRLELRPLGGLIVNVGIFRRAASPLLNDFVDSVVEHVEPCDDLVLSTIQVLQDVGWHHCGR